MAKIIKFSDKLKDKTKKGTLSSHHDPVTLKLWYLSQDFDALVTRAILEQNTKPEELAVIIAHRLGALIKCSEQQGQLIAFCTTILERALTEEEKQPSDESRGKGA